MARRIVLKRVGRNPIGRRYSLHLVHKSGTTRPLYHVNAHSQNELGVFPIYAMDLSSERGHERCYLGHARHKSRIDSTVYVRAKEYGKYLAGENGWKFEDRTEEGLARAAG